jgi:hypothetical protein
MLAAGCWQKKSGLRVISGQYHRNIASSLIAILWRYHGNITPPENLVADRPTSHLDLRGARHALLIQIQDSLHLRRKPAPAPLRSKAPKRQLCADLAQRLFLLAQR